MLSNLQNQLVTVVFSKHYSSRRKQCICIDTHLALLSSRTVHVRLSQNKLQCVFMVMKEHVTCATVCLTDVF